MAVLNPYHITRQFNGFLEKEHLLGHREAIDDVLAQYRNVRGGLIPVLQRLQGIIRYLPPVVHDYIALKMNLSSADIFGVVSFYSFFTMKPQGRHIIKVCLGTACYVKGAMKIIEHINKDLHLPLGETTTDRRYTLEGVRCLGACGLAPVLMVNEETHGHVEPTKIISLLDAYH